MQLLGRPAVVVDGVAAPPPRGAKPWALLAFLAGSARARQRSEVAQLLFGEADDPLGALRWNLAAVRRLLGLPDVLKGDELVLNLPAGAVVDTWLVTDGAEGALGLASLGNELLAGLAFPDSPGFELWLLNERRRLTGATAGLLQRAAVMCLAAGDPVGAVDFAERLVALDPLDEGHQALLIRSRVATGDVGGARQQLKACREVLRRELGVEPGPAVLVAATLPVVDTDREVDPGDAARAAIGVGWSVFLAGAMDYGFETLRHAVEAARRASDDVLRADAMLTLSAMLGIAVRGADEALATGAGLVRLADAQGRGDVVADAYAILGGTAMMQADQRAAIGYCRRALDASAAHGPRATALTFLGASEADLGDTKAAVDHLEEAAAEAGVDGGALRIYYAASHLARVRLTREEWSRARPQIEVAIDAAAGSATLLPWPLAMLAEVERAEGRLDAGARAATRSTALAATVGLAWAEALALRAGALIDAARGDHKRSVSRLTAALRAARSTRSFGYTYHWPIAFVLDSLCDVAALDDADLARHWASALRDHASRAGMTEFVLRACRYLAALGDQAAHEVAAALAAEGGVGPPPPPPETAPVRPTSH